MKAAKRAMAATATVASRAKAALKAKAATNPVAKAVAHAAKAEVTDATAVVAAVDVVQVVAVVRNAKVALSGNVLTPRANPCQWTPICKPVVSPKAAQTPIAKSHVQIAHPVSGENAVAAVAVAANATNRVNASSNRVQKPAPMQQ